MAGGCHPGSAPARIEGDLVGLRFRKSISLGGGVRLNVSKRGFGMNAGTRGARVSVHSSGRTTRTVGIPGSGISYSKSSGGGRRRSGSSGYVHSVAERAAVKDVADLIPKAEMLAPAYEKAFAKGMRAFAQGKSDEALTHFAEATASDTKGRARSDDFFYAITLIKADQRPEAIDRLETVVQADKPLPDELMQKYVPGATPTFPSRITSSRKSLSAVPAPSYSLLSAIRMRTVSMRRS